MHLRLLQKLLSVLLYLRMLQFYLPLRVLSVLGPLRLTSRMWRNSVPWTSMASLCWLLIIVVPVFGVVRSVVVREVLLDVLVPLYLLIRSELTECMIMCSYETMLCSRLLSPLLGMAWVSVWQVLDRQCNSAFLEWVTPHCETHLAKLEVALITLCIMDPGSS